jgi:hypothetical protein
MAGNCKEADEGAYIVSTLASDADALWSVHQAQKGILTKNRYDPAKKKFENLKIGIEQNIILVRLPLWPFVIGSALAATRKAWAYLAKAIGFRRVNA